VGLVGKTDRAVSVLWRAVPIAIACAACRATTTPTPVDPNAPAAGPHTGAVAIEYLTANVSPGSTISGCGAAIGGCAGRLRLSFRLRSASAGTVLSTSATLHGTNRRACLQARGAGFPLGANAVVTIDLTFDQVDTGCALPFDATDMGVNVEGTTEVESRQEFAIRYRFAP
jgi:hypothetical protein